MDADELSLLYELYGAEFTKWLWYTFDHVTIENMISHTYELRRDPKEREAEKTQRSLNSWIQDNPDLVAEFTNL